MILRTKDNKRRGDLPNFRAAFLLLGRCNVLGPKSGGTSFSVCVEGDIRDSKVGGMILRFCVQGILAGWGICLRMGVIASMNGGE